MIQYDSHDWDIYYRARGSIFPKSILFSLPSALLAFGLSYSELLVDVELTQGQGVYSGFTFVLGFILVFRTSQSYQRYWHAATAVHNMKAEWCDACGSLIAFAQTSKMSSECVTRFSHTLIRLFALMHAMALEEMSGVEDEIQFPLLDIEGLEQDNLKLLSSGPAQGRTVEIVCQWIKITILRGMNTGVLDVPPPILTRVFQELGTGLVNYHEAVQVVIWPFPFPYAQMGAVLIVVYTLLTPLVVCTWSDSPYYCFMATLVSLVCMKGLEMIAVELENPFGTDPNDLPLAAMHAAVNRDLTLLVNPQTWQIPQLLDTALVDYDELISSLVENNNLTRTTTLRDMRRQSRTSKTSGGSCGSRGQKEPDRRRTGSVASGEAGTSAKAAAVAAAKAGHKKLLGAAATSRRAKQRKMTNWHNTKFGLEDCDRTKERTAGMLGVRIDTAPDPLEGCAPRSPQRSTSPAPLDAPAGAPLVISCQHQAATGGSHAGVVAPNGTEGRGAGGPPRRAPESLPPGRGAGGPPRKAPESLPPDLPGALSGGASDAYVGDHSRQTSAESS